MTTAISLANGKNGLCQVNSYCRNIHLDFPFLRFRLMDRNSILAHRCRLAYATCGMWEVLFIVVQTKIGLKVASRSSELTLPTQNGPSSSRQFGAVNKIQRPFKKTACRKIAGQSRLLCLNAFLFSDTAFGNGHRKAARQRCQTFHCPPVAS